MCTYRADARRCAMDNHRRIYSGRTIHGRGGSRRRGAAVPRRCAPAYVAPARRRRWCHHHTAAKHRHEWARVAGGHPQPNLIACYFPVDSPVRRRLLVLDVCSRVLRNNAPPTSHGKPQSPCLISPLTIVSAVAHCRWTAAVPDSEFAPTKTPHLHASAAHLHGERQRATQHVRRRRGPVRQRRVEGRQAIAVLHVARLRVRVEQRVGVAHGVAACAL